MGTRQVQMPQSSLLLQRELQPFSLVKCTRDGHRTLADFQSPEIVGSDQCSRCFREERLSGTLHLPFSLSLLRLTFPCFTL